MSKELDGPSILVLALVGGALAGDQLANIAETALWRAPALMTPAHAPPDTERETSVPPLTAVSDRNLFGAARDESPATASKLPSSHSPCPTLVRLLGTVVDSGVPPWSTAVVMESHSVQIVSEGMQLGGEYAVTRVERGQITLRNGVTTFACSMWDVPTGQAATTPAVTAAAPQRVDPQTWIIPREWLNAQRDHPSEALRGSRFMPTSSGIQVAVSRPGTVPYELGLRSGDRIVEINGQSLSPETALELYAQLPTRNRWHFTLQRGEAQHSFVYNVKE